MTAARALLAILTVCLLACGGALWFVLREPAPAARVISGAALRPAHEPTAPPERREQPARSAIPVVPEQDAPPEELPAPKIARGEIRSDPLFFDSVQRPEMDARDGPLAKELYPNGRAMYEAHMRQLAGGMWVLDGAWSSWWENGQLQELGEYREEVEHGRWQWWQENGEPIADGSFEYGMREGRWHFWYQSGGKMMEAEYLHGEGAGMWTLYHENGHRAAEGIYSEGEISGPWTIWNEEGSIDFERTGTYERGQRIGT